MPSGEPPALIPAVNRKQINPSIQGKRRPAGPPIQNIDEC